MLFATIILFKNWDNKESGRVKLIKIGLKASIIDMLYTKTWSGMLISAMSVFVAIMSICLVGACFSIAFYKILPFEMKAVIIFEYIVVCGNILKRSISDKNLCPELLLSLTFCKQYWVYARLIYWKHFILSANF